MKIKGYTPALDTLIEKYNLTCACVYGKVWRYEQMKDGKCKASQERIANELSITRKTANKYLLLLEKDGYIKREGGGKGLAPIEWTTTGLAGVEFVGVAYDKMSPKVTTDVTESDIKVSPKVTQRKDIKKQDKKDELSPLEKFISAFGSFTEKERELGYETKLNDLRFDVGKDKLNEMILWAASKEDMTRTQAVNAMCKAAPTWNSGNSKQPHNQKVLGRIT